MTQAAPIPQSSPSTAPALQEINNAEPQIYTPDILRKDYQFIRLLGEGSNGKTWLAISRKDQRKVAIKALKLFDHFKSLELFKREAETLKQIQTQGVPKLIEFIETPDKLDECYIVQDFFDFPSIQNIIDEFQVDGKRFSEFHTLDIIYSVAQILNVLQTEYTPPMIHRDIKPSNILYDQHQKRAMLIDFGSVATPSKKTEGSTVAGTQGFMAPEQLLGECTTQSDFYGLGATALYMLTGVSPANMSYDKDNPFQLQFDEIFQNTKISIPTQNLIKTLLSPQVENRPKDTAALLQTIQTTQINARLQHKKRLTTKDKIVNTIIVLSLVVFCIYLYVQTIENDPKVFYGFLKFLGLAASVAVIIWGFITYYNTFENTFEFPEWHRKSKPCVSGYKNYIVIQTKHPQYCVYYCSDDRQYKLYKSSKTQHSTQQGNTDVSEGQAIKLKNGQTYTVVDGTTQFQSSSETPTALQISSKPQNAQLTIDPELVALLKDKYDIEACIGKGAQSNVYKAKRCADNIPVAIKQIRVNSVKDWKQYELFDREAEVLKSLNIQGTAKFYEAIKSFDNNNPISVIVQEYIDGRSLQSYLNQQTHFPFTTACEILLQILKILQNLHQQNSPIIHRDIKPSNIILRYDDDKYCTIPEVFIIDFGAVANPLVKDGGSTVTGTYGYMAPEQLIGQPTTASDIYSFGILAMYLFSGVSPEKIETKDLQLLIDPHLEHLPYAVTAFIRQLTELSPTQRLTDYQTIQAILESFKLKSFDIAIKQKQKTTDTHRLKNVNNIGQKGNLALWQELPNNPTRKLPRIYKNIIPNLPKWIYDYSFIYHSFIFALLSMMLFPLEHRGLAFLCAAIFLPIVFCLKDNGHYLPIFINALTRNRDLIHLFKHGRKSLATISNIEFLPPIAEEIPHTTKKDISAYLLEALHKKQSSPSPKWKKTTLAWRIEYYFNPPDDDNPDPVHHVYYSEVPPVDLKIGDTLPILYLVKQGKVYSIPYPLPLYTDIPFSCPNAVPKPIKPEPSIPL